MSHPRHQLDAAAMSPTFIACAPLARVFGTGTLHVTDEGAGLAGLHAPDGAGGRRRLCYVQMDESLTREQVREVLRVLAAAPKLLAAASVALDAIEDAGLAGEIEAESRALGDAIQGL